MTKILRWTILLLLGLTACSSGVRRPAVPPTPAQTHTPTVTLPAPGVTMIPAPDAQTAAQDFFEAWKAADYAKMYTLLNQASQDAISLEAFTKRYADVAQTATVKSLDYQVQAAITNPQSAQAEFQVTLHTTLVGELHNAGTLNLNLEKGSWRVQWEDGLILAQLRGGNTLERKVTSQERGDIYDRNGKPIAIQTDVVSLAVIAGKVNSSQTNWVLSTLSRLTGLAPDVIRGMYENDQTMDGAYVPIGEAERSAIDNYDELVNVDWLYTGDYTGRFYPLGGVAPIVTGYVRTIQKGEEAQYDLEGYTISARVPEGGIELWGDSYLRGQPAVTLDLKDPQGGTSARLAQRDAIAPQSITLTIDRTLQVEAQKAMAGFTGALVVLERDTGRVLAMVSSPGFDPNAFEINNYNSSTLAAQYHGDTSGPFYNRATGGGYEPGSVFKVITMAAALESGLFTPDTTYDCQYKFTELPDRVLYDWTFEKGYDPSGMLTLPEGLMRSCDPWFYHIGVTLARNGHGDAISKMARAFGLGSPTGIGEGVTDEPGNVPDAPEEFTMTQLAIGQSQILANPLQVARFMAAIGNGGTLYRPQVVEKIAGTDGPAAFTFKAEAQGTLPVKPENLQVIQKAMGWVVSSPRGTAVDAFEGFPYRVYGKTGTAQNDVTNYPHAWFAGYTDAGQPNRPDIAFAVVGEHAGEGSEIAAPIARRILEVYFQGKPQRLFPWERRIYVPKTPTPDAANAPAASQPDIPAKSARRPGAPTPPGVGTASTCARRRPAHK